MVLHTPSAEGRHRRPVKRSPLSPWSLRRSRISSVRNLRTAWMSSIIFYLDYVVVLGHGGDGVGYAPPSSSRCWCVLSCHAPSERPRTAQLSIFVIHFNYACHRCPPPTEQGRVTELVAACEDGLGYRALLVGCVVELNLHRLCGIPSGWP